MSSTSEVPAWKTEFDQRISAFANSTKIPEPVVREVLSELGVDGQDADCLTMLDNEDVLQTGVLINEFVEKRKVAKIARLRLGLSHLRGSTHLNEVVESANNNDGMNEVANAIKDMVASNRLKSEWTDKELLAHYDENETEIAKILSQRSHGRPCIVFQGDGTINTEISLELLKIAKRQSTSDQYQVNGKAVRVYRPGEFLVKPLDESPLIPGSVLVNGYCSQSDTSWAEIERKRRVIIRLHVNKVETAKLSTREMRQICNDAASMNNEQFEQEYSKAAMFYAEMEEQGNLPSLKILPSEIRNVYQSKKDTGFSGPSEEYTSF